MSTEDPLEWEMGTHSSIFAWEILQTEESGRLQSTGLQSVGHDLVTEDAHPCCGPGIILEVRDNTIVIPNMTFSLWEILFCLEDRQKTILIF